MEPEEKAKQHSTVRSKEMRPLVSSFELLEQLLAEPTVNSLVTWFCKSPSLHTSQAGQFDSVGFSEGVLMSKRNQCNVVY